MEGDGFVGCICGYQHANSNELNKNTHNLVKVALVWVSKWMPSMS